MVTRDFDKRQEEDSGSVMLTMISAVEQEPPNNNSNQGVNGYQRVAALKSRVPCRRKAVPDEAGCWCHSSILRRVRSCLLYFRYDAFYFILFQDCLVLTVDQLHQHSSRHHSQLEIMV